jgi:hypothetical protein
MARKLTCKNCGATSSPEDAGTNWNPLGRRYGKMLYECDCGYGLFAGLFLTSIATPQEVQDQRRAMQDAGIDPSKDLSTGDREKILKEAPPGDTDFEVGDRVTHPLYGLGTVKSVEEEAGNRLVAVLFDEGWGSVALTLNVPDAKLRKT